MQLAKRFSWRAVLTMEPFGVLSLDETNGFQLWRAPAWFRHRGGMSVHYADLRARRTIVVDHLEFTPNARPGLDRDELGRVFARITLTMAFGLAATAPIDERDLCRVFIPSEADRVLAALRALKAELMRSPLPWSEATADVEAAIIRRTDDVLYIR